MAAAIAAGPSRRNVGDQCGGQLPDFAGPRVQAMRGELRQARGARGELDERGPVLDDRVAQAQVERAELFFRVGAEQHDDAARGASLVDGGARQPEHDIGREPVGELCVDVVRAEHAFGQLGPCVRRFIGEACATEDPDARRAGFGERTSRGPQGLRPRGPHELITLGVELAERVAAHERPAEAAFVVERLEAEALLVGKPAPVDRVAVDAHEAQHAVARRLDRDARADGVDDAGGLDLFEIPRAGLEAIRLRGERTHRADLHRVATEVRRERIVGEGVDLGEVAPSLEVDQRVTSHLLREARAAIAQDATLAVEVDEIADRDGLFEVALLFDEARLARAVGHGLILQRALAALVAHRAIERVVDQQEFEHALAAFHGLGVLRVHHHAFGHRRRARRLQLGHLVDLHQADATGGIDAETGVVAVIRDLDASFNGGLEDRGALGHR